ncbi:MAG: GNAT family N-acetyltransferase [Solirubrobacterales bacterium]|nr:GNAT family N-acetyltransferase [Solirubrobacterales bacterium]
MAIREATDADLEALLPLLRGYCDFYDAAPSDDGLERMARAVIALPEEEAFLLVAVDGAGEISGAAAGEVVGFAACAWKWSSLRGARIVVLDDLFVAAAARGGGHADALIEATAEVARRHGAPVVTWLTAPDNHRAQAVYNRVGGHSETFLEYELEL